MTPMQIIHRNSYTVRRLFHERAQTVSAIHCFCAYGRKWMEGPRKNVEDEDVSSSPRSTESKGSPIAVGSKERSPRRSTQLEDQLWFHGSISRPDAVLLLERDGDFLVRTTIKDLPEMVLSLRCRGVGVQHILVKHDTGGWSFEDKSCKTMFDLIRHHFRSKIPVRRDTDWILSRGIQRDDWVINHRSFKEEKLLGEGAFGEVFKGVVKRGEKWLPAAIKRFKGAMSDTDRDVFLQEAKLMKAYSHPNVVTLYGVAVSKPPIRMIIEFCENGSLDIYLKENADNVTQRDKIKMCLDAARGMEYLEGKGCVHRDLATRNCLLGANCEVKIADFGMSREGKESDEFEEVKIPVRWAAPETLTERVWTHATDSYSFGVVIWEIFNDCAIPWTEILDNQSVAMAVISGRKLKFPEGTHKTILSITKRCWNTVADKRLKFRQIRFHLEKLYNAEVKPSKESPEIA